MKSYKVFEEMSIKFLLTISCHKICTKSISKFHYNSIKRLNIPIYASNIREKLGSRFVRIFGRPQFRSLSVDPKKKSQNFCLNKSLHFQKKNLIYDLRKIIQKNLTFTRNT